MKDHFINNFTLNVYKEKDRNKKSPFNNINRYNSKRASEQHDVRLTHKRAASLLNISKKEVGSY